MPDGSTAELHLTPDPWLRGFDWSGVLPDATLDNGCVWAAPGLHRRGTLEHHFVDPLGWLVFDQPPVPVPVPAGGAVVLSSLTPQLTEANTSDAVRKAYIVQYMPDGSLLYEGGPAAPVVMDDDERYPWVLAVVAASAQSASVVGVEVGVQPTPRATAHDRLDGTGLAVSAEQQVALP